MESFFFPGLAERWPAGREDYHWHVLPDIPQISEHLTVPYRDLTARSGLAPVAPEWCHITIWHDAPVEEISEYALKQAADRVRARCEQLHPFVAQIRRPEVWPDAVVCPVHPGPKFRQLQTLVRGATAEFTGVRHQSGPLNYHPHMTLAYATGQRGEGELRDWLCDHDLPEPRLRVTTLTLVKQKYGKNEITWSVLDKIPFGSA